MKLLFGDRLAPITSTIGFLEADYQMASRAFLEWQVPVQRKRLVSFKEQSVRGELERVLRLLLPLTDKEARRFLFMPTSSNWTAFFDNGYRGTDAATTISYLTRLIGCRGLRITVIPDTIEGEFKSARGRYGAVILEIYGTAQTDFLNIVRSIAVVNDGSNWSFEESGTPLGFENLEKYNKVPIKERFNFEQLDNYLKKLGVAAFEQTFYLPPNKLEALLLEKKGPLIPTWKNYTLSEARKNF